MATQLPQNFEQPRRFQNTSQNLSIRFPPSVLRPVRQGQGNEPRKTVAPTSFIFFPSEGQRTTAGDVVIKGYAFTDTSREIERVELSIDGGKTWENAELSPNPQPGEWRLWRKQLTLAPGTYQLAVRASDHSPDPNANQVSHRINFQVTV